MDDDLGDLLDKYFSRQAVQAVQLTDAGTIARVGRWMIENGAPCGWISASGSMALMRAGDHANEIWMWRENGERRDTVGLGDWVVQLADDEFLLIKNRTFQAIYERGRA